MITLFCNKDFVGTCVKISATIVGWQSRACWAHIDIFNLLGIDPYTTDLTWEIVDARPRQIVKKLRPNGPAIIPPDGVSITLINAFRSKLFNILYPSVQHGEELHVGDATPDSQKELAEALDKINGAKLDGYPFKHNNISGGNRLAGSSAALLAQGSSAAAQAAGSSSVMSAYVQDEPEGTKDDPIPLDEDGTRDGPIDLSGDSAPAPASIDNSQALVLIPMHQQDKFMQLTKLEATPMHFRYVITPSRLRAMAKRYTNNKAAIVVGVVRRPDWNAAQTFPEYICIASLKGGSSLCIRVKRYSIEGKELPKWPGGGSVYLSLKEIKEYGYLFRPFCTDFNKERLRRYLTVMEEQDKTPNVRDKAVVLRGR
ncbi:hypothetical protein K469DRAFT_695459 [Zopfia rhizophila CBS 207.26]|uniref:Uncharacterized protein n=1 Tax=Zopfia rhizophila CBS 207.26 TaxID=1314779 RepID=A0A6A6DGN3_9PEZI|nr:hypothetical protein K469DRAFT_695459 [Zopfia rhizophila CBS 207.26]